MAGRAPFTVTLAARIDGGAPPFQATWDYGNGAPAASGTTAPPEVYAAGEYTATVRVEDSRGASAVAERRIVALGDSPAPPRWKYGVTAPLGRHDPGFFPADADVTRAAELAQQAGVQAVRLEFSWDKINPAPDHWDFADYDAIVQTLRAHNLEILGVLAYSSWWGSSAQASNDWRVRLYSPPARPYDFARYAYETAAHFKGQVRAWQVWNSPNSALYWKPAPDAARYAALVRETYLAIKYADPGAAVVLGGLEGNGVEGYDTSGLASDFLQSTLAAGARGYFDIAALHPYMLPNSGIKTVTGRVTSARAVLQKSGSGDTPIWITEIGVPTDAAWWPTAPLQSEAAAADWLEQIYTRLGDVVPTIFWYTLKDQGTGDAAEEHFGLLRADFSPKPAYDRLKRLATGK